MEKLVFKRLGVHSLPIPSYQTEGSSGMDIHAFVEKSLIIKPGEWKLIPTGFAIQIPSGYEIQVRPRSGLALKYGVTVLNAPGTIDSDYRGEIAIILINHSKIDFTVKQGDRIAQLIVQKVAKLEIDQSLQLEGSERGSGGFGSTGI